MADLRERFWAKTRKEGECLLWTGASYGRYGAFLCRQIGPRAITRGAHIVAYCLSRGEDVPKGMMVCHTCDNGHCVRPEHLFLGTAVDNMRDKVVKGRQTRGEQQHLAKLTEDKVRLIRRYSPTKSCAAMAREFGVNASTVERVVRGETWQGV